MDIFDKRRMEDEYDLNRRKKEIYEKIPKIQEIDNFIVEKNVEKAKSLILGDKSKVPDLDLEVKEAKDEKITLLISNGFSKDYMEIKYVCPICKDTGYIGSEKCICFKNEINKLLYKDSNLAEVLKTDNFDSFNLNYYSDKLQEGEKISPRKRAEDAFLKAKRYVSDFEENHGNLLICGSPGTGKTFLTHCIAKEIIDKMNVVFYKSSWELFDIIRINSFGNSLEKRNNPYDMIFEADLLIIDDLGSEANNSLTIPELFTVVNERLLSKKATIISTNFMPTGLRKTYLDRIFSRLSNEYDFIYLVGDDIREKIKK
jgi:DNA replication protein DnaC